MIHLHYGQPPSTKSVCVNRNYHHVIYGIQMQGCILMDMSLTKLWNNLVTAFVCSIYVIGYNVHFNGYMPDENSGLIWMYSYLFEKS